MNDRIGELLAKKTLTVDEMLELAADKSGRITVTTHDGPPWVLAMNEDGDPQWTRRWPTFPDVPR